MSEPTPSPAVSAPAVSAEAEAADADARRRVGVRVLLVLGVVLIALMVAFGQATASSYDQFEAYRQATLEDPDQPPRWQAEAVDVDGCVDEILDWIEACPGVSSWCESTLPDITQQCLASQDRRAYCDEVGDAIMSTRFGFGECSARYDAIEGRYARRYAKKHCSLIYRTIAGHCADLRGVGPGGGSSR